MDVEERLSLEAVNAHTLIAVEHRHRYAVAARVCGGRRVIDLCCGSGYGTVTLARAGATVVGVDRSAAAVDAARAACDDERATYVVADALAHLRSVRAEDVDVIVCFEGLEHLTALDEVVGELRRLAACGVGLLLSVPNSATFGEINEHHVTDFDLDLVRRTFGDLPALRIVLQAHAEGSLLRPLAEAHTVLAAPVRLEGQQDPEWANHFLLLSGIDVEDLLPEGDVLAHVAIAPVNHRYMRGLELANARLLAENGRLARERLGLAPGGAGSRRQELEHDLDGLRSDVEELRRRLDAAGARAQAAEADVAVARAERDRYRRAHVVVHHSRLTRLAARLAGHRF